jgi:NitT/TauT family transport system permease protein
MRGKDMPGGRNRQEVHRARTERVLAALVFVGFLATWAGLIWVRNMSPLVLPSPLRVWNNLVANLANGHLLVHAWVTLQEIILGFLGGSALGIGLGTAVAHSQMLLRVLNPYIIASQAMPKLALAPIFVLWFGFGIFPKVVIAALIAFFPLLENTITGLNEVDPDKIELFRSLDATPWQIFLKLRLPNAVPFLFAGLRVAVVLSVVGAIVGEYVGANRGLGALIIASQGTMDTPLMFSVFVVLTVLGYALYKLMELLERVCLKWRYEERD